MDTNQNQNQSLRCSFGDLRGPVGAFTDDFAARLGYAFALWLAQRRGTTPDTLKLAVGRDPRPSGARLQAAFTRGLTAADCDVVDCGLCTTPAMFRTTVDDAVGAQAAVMVTGSHRERDINGFKFLMPDGMGEGDVSELLRRAEEVRVPERLVTKTAYLDRYAEFLKDFARRRLKDDALKPLLGLKVVVDAQHGSGGFFARLLEELGAETAGSLHLSPTGEFPSVIPNPEKPDTLAALAQAVTENGADLGVMFDPDCDRAAIVDQDGRVIHRDRLIALAAAILLGEHPGATIVTDSVTSSGLNQFITEWGGIHYRYKRGHHSVIEEAARLNAEGIDCPLAIETSGHAAFRDNYFQDDGMYLATWLICQALDLKREGQTLSQLIEELREPVERVEVRLRLTGENPADSSWDVIQTVLSHTLEDPAWRLANDNREGVRIEFNLADGIDNGWFLLRASLHDPVLALNAESDLEGGVKEMLQGLYALLKENHADELDLTPLAEAIGAE